MNKLNKITFIFLAAIGINTIGCSENIAVQKDLEKKSLNSKTSQNEIAPGAPGEVPYWAYAGKNGIGTSYEQYLNGVYSNEAVTKSVSKVWFSLAQGVITETMFGLIHQAQIKEMQFIVSGQIAGEDFVATELEDTNSTIEYLHQDKMGRPLSLAYKVTNTDKLGRFEIEKHIFTDPDHNTLFVRSYFKSFKGELTAYVSVNPYVDNSGIGDSAKVDGDALIAWEMDNFVSLTASKPFKAKSVGFIGTSDGLSDLKNNYKLDHQYLSTGDKKGNVGLFAELGQFNAKTQFDLALGFGKTQKMSLSAASNSLEIGYKQVLANFNGEGEAVGWQDYIENLMPLKKMYANTADNGKLLNTSAMVLKAQEDKTHAGAVIASLSNPWGDTANASKGSTGYKAVWVRDFYQVAMAFMALGDPQTAKTAFEYLIKVQVTENTPGNKGDTGWFLQKTHVDGKLEWVGVQLDQTAMPIMLAWKLSQAGILSEDELKNWYQEMLKPAADFLVNGGLAKILWNDIQIVPPITQQERWEEQSGYSPSTTAAIIAGLVSAYKIANISGDEINADKYLATAKKYSADIEPSMFTTQGNIKKENGQYYFRLGQDKDANSNTKLNSNNGRVGLNKKEILDGGFLELVRYGVRSADDSAILDTLAEFDDETLTENLRIKYSFTFDDTAGTFPGWRRYGNDGYGEDQINGQNYAQGGKNTPGQRGRVWPFFTGERGHFELASLLVNDKNPTIEQIESLKNTYVKGMELFANDGMMLPEQVWDNIGVNPKNYTFGEGTNSATPLAWTHAEYVKLVRSLTQKQVWDHYPIVTQMLKTKKL